MLPPRMAKRRIIGDKKHTPAAASFAPDHLDLVRMIAMRGADDADMARCFGVTPAVWKAWRDTYPSLNDALDKGRMAPDAEVVVSLYKRATGYDYVEDAAVGGRDPTVMEVRRHAPPDVGAIRLWITNRQPSNWVDKSRSEHTGAGGGPIGLKAESRNDIIDAILGLIVPKADGPNKPPPGQASGSKK